MQCIYAISFVLFSLQGVHLHRLFPCRVRRERNPRPLKIAGKTHFFMIGFSPIITILYAVFSHILPHFFVRKELCQHTNPLFFKFFVTKPTFA